MQVRQIGTFEGKPVDEVTLTDASGVALNIMTYGVVVRDWRVPVAGGSGPKSVALGFDEFEPYPDHSPHFGSLAGRVANRIGDGRFSLNGKTYQLPCNEGAHSLHGGPDGLGRQIWEMDVDSAQNAVRFTHNSPDGAMNYPGAVNFSATYRLEGNKVHLALAGMPDRETPISLVQHHYFNLGDGEDVLDHRLKLNADRCTPTDETLLPSGEILPVEGTDLDFRTARVLRDAKGQALDLDINMVLADGRDRQAPVAEVVGPDGALTLKLWTDRDAVQLYNGVWTDSAVPGLNGKMYGKHSGLCLEDQAFPNAVNQHNFPSIICSPDAPYAHQCAIEIA